MIARAGRLATTVEYHILAMLLAGMSLIVFLGTFDRYAHVIPGGVAWADQIGRLLLVWISLIGMQTVQREDTHYQVRIIRSLLPARPNFVLRVFCRLLSLGFIGLVAFESILYCIRVAPRMYVGAIPVPLILHFLPLLIASALMTWYLLVQLMATLRQTENVVDGSASPTAE
jgi:TRAP-type C4-dicarboxylate transport system permease small subunit